MLGERLVRDHHDTRGSVPATTSARIALARLSALARTPVNGSGTFAMPLSYKTLPGAGVPPCSGSNRANVAKYAKPLSPKLSAPW